MKVKLKLLLRYVERYGFNGFLLFSKVYIFRKSRVNVPGFGSFSLRKKTMDAEILTQVFIYKQYDFPIGGGVKTIMDLGANNGMSACFFSKKFPDSIIYAVEPDPDNFKILKRNTSGYENIKPVNKAIWFENGFIYLDDGDSWSIKVDNLLGRKKVEAITISSFIEQNGIDHVDLLKIDIEGAEKEVFTSDTSFILSVRNLVIELHDWMKEGCAKAFFNSFGNFSYALSIRHENILLTDIKKQV